MTRKSLLTSFALVSCAALPAQYRYQEQPNLFAAAPTVRTEGCLMVDVDGDGDLDVVFANGYVLSSGGQALAPHLLINKLAQGQGFANESTTRLPAAAIRGTLAIAFDIENDGDLDLVFSCNGPSQQRLYVNDGTGHFSDESVQRLGVLNIAAAGCAYADVDQDGDLDLFFNDELSNGQLKLLLNDGSGHFTNVTATHVAAAPKTNQQDVVVCDVDNDFDLDVVNVGKSFGQQIFFNDGTGHFPTVTTSLLPPGGSLSYEAEAADLDGDGDLDIAMLSVSGTTDAVLRNNLIPNGTLSFSNLTSALVGGNGDDDNEWVLVDTDNDGLLDLVNGTLTGGAEKLYRNNGSFQFVRQTGLNGFSPVNDPTLDVAVGDLNGDGVFDFVTAQGEFGNFTNRAYYGTGPADTQPPRFVHVEQLPAVSTNPDGPWSIRAVIQDSMVDDGETSVAAAVVDWSIQTAAGTVTGSTPMRFLGGLMFRGDVEPPAGMLTNGASVTFTLTATDRRGNTASSAPQSFQVCGLQRYGLGIGGNNTAMLTAIGSTSPGTTTTLNWSAAGPSTTGILAAALGTASNALPQGTLLVDPTQIITVVPISTDPSGTGQLAIPIPPIAPLIGLHVAFQGIFDVPLSLSNGVELVICP